MGYDKVNRAGGWNICLCGFVDASEIARCLTMCDLRHLDVSDLRLDAIFSLFVFCFVLLFAVDITV